MLGGKMRIGSLATSRTKSVALIATAAATAFIKPAIFCQSPYRSGGGGQGATQALYMAPAENETRAPGPQYVDRYGNQMIVPASYYSPCDGNCGNGCPC